MKMRRCPSMCPIGWFSLSDAVFSIVSMALCELVSVGSELIQPPAWHTKKLRAIPTPRFKCFTSSSPHTPSRADFLTTDATATIHSQFAKLRKGLRGGY